MTSRKLQSHPLADRMPAMPQKQYDALKASIRELGQIDPIVLLNGKILDGKHRARILAELGITPKTVEFDPAWGSPVEYVIAKASHRSMTIGQRAWSAALFKDDLAKARKAHDKDGGTTGLDASVTGNSRDYAALRFGVSPRQVQDACLIRQESPELFDELGAGRINVGQARNRLKRKRREASVRRLRRSDAAAMPADALELLHGDCIERMRAMPERSVRCIFADPPYNNGWSYDADPHADQRPADDFVAWCQGWIAAAVRTLADDGSIFVLIDDQYSDPIGCLLRAAGLHRRRTIVWWESFGNHTPDNFTCCARFIHYYTRRPDGFVFNGADVLVPSTRQVIGDKRAVPGGKVPDNVWVVSRKQGTAADRVPFADAPPQLPVEIPERCVLVASNPGDVVMDPFNGNGTTAIAALRHGRRYVGIDRSAKYLKQSRQWIAASLDARDGKGQER